MDTSERLRALPRRLPPCGQPLELRVQRPPGWRLRDALHASRRGGTWPARRACESRHIAQRRQRLEPSFGCALRSCHSRPTSRCHGFQGRSLGPGSRLQVPSTRAALARPGPGATPFPGVSAPLPPSDALPPSAPTPVPRAGGLPRCGRWCSAHGANDTGARQQGGRRRRGTGAPRPRDGSRRGEGLPGAGAVLVVRARVAPPAGDAPLLAHSGRGRCGLRGHPALSASGKVRGCGAASPRARTFACRRIAEAIADPIARLATGSGGLTRGRAGCAPARRHTTFPGVLASSNPL
jgi:hypothetical protein